jgi:flagellar protein FlbT
MALEIALKPQERVVVGNAVVRNAGRHTTHLVVETPVPVLRQRDILSTRDAVTPCRRIYLALQLLYLEPTRTEHLQDVFVELVKDVKTAAPSLTPALEEISVLVASGDTYRALRAAKTLLRQERALLGEAAPLTENRPALLATLES